MNPKIKEKERNKEEGKRKNFSPRLTLGKDYILHMTEGFIPKNQILEILNLKNEIKNEKQSPNEEKYTNPVLIKIKEHRRQTLTLQEILNTKAKWPKNLVLYELDKNTERIYVECPILWEKRIKKEITENSNFEEIREENQKIEEKFWEMYSKNNFKTLGRWKNGTLPYSFVIPKYKDPPNKSRLICSYSQHFLKEIFQLTSHALTWMFSSLKGKIRNFNLFRLDELIHNLKDSRSYLKSTYGEDTNIITLQSDIKQMYTNLQHHEIHKAIDWLLTKSQKNCNSRLRNRNFVLISKYKNETNKHEIHWSTGNGGCQWKTLTKEKIQKIINIDLNNAYQIIDGRIFRQIKGCPIGGFMSAIYANVQCAYNEYSWLASLKTQASLLAGIRQMDDLLLLIAYNKNKPHSKEDALKLKNQCLRKNMVYKGGLELEEQKPIWIHKKEICHKFAGTLITFDTDNPTLRIAPFIKNEESLLKNGCLEYPRFIEKTSFIPKVTNSVAS